MGNLKLSVILGSAFATSLMSFDSNVNSKALQEKKWVPLGIQMKTNFLFIVRLAYTKSI